LVINDAKLVFDGDLDIRKSTKDIIIHHQGADAPQSVQQIHAYYLNRTDDNYLGIGYHYYIRKDGGIWRGRPENTVGAHSKNHNTDSIGICFEGNYQKETVMPAVQFNSGVELLRNILGRYPGLAIKKHKDYNATDCPGQYFPFDKMAVQAKTPVIPIPAGLKATPVSYNSIKLTWTAVSGITGYAVYRYSNTKRAYELIKQVTVNNVTDTGLAENTKYSYLICAFKLSGSVKTESGKTSVVSATTLVKPKTIGVGTKVKIVTANAVYGGASKGVKVPSSYKNKPYTVSQVGTAKVNPNQVLLKELYSWVYIKDIQIV